MMTTLTAGELRAVLAEVPDDAPVTVVLNNLTGYASLVTAAEALNGADWGWPTEVFVQLQIEAGAGE